MPEYIEREEIKKALLGWDYDPSDDDIECAINRIPAADVVEVVRCKDCRRATEDIMLDGFYDCVKDDLIHSADHFCRHGRRKEGAEE